MLCCLAVKSDVLNYQKGGYKRLNIPLERVSLLIKYCSLGRGLKNTPCSSRTRSSTSSVSEAGESIPPSSC